MNACYFISDEGKCACGLGNKRLSPVEPSESNRQTVRDDILRSVSEVGKSCVKTLVKSER